MPSRLGDQIVNTIVRSERVRARLGPARRAIIIAAAEGYVIGTCLIILIVVAGVCMVIFRVPLTPLTLAVDAGLAIALVAVGGIMGVLGVGALFSVLTAATRLHE